MILKNGVYTAKARGMAGWVTVRLTVAENQVIAVDLDLSTETPIYGQKAEKQLKTEILQNQSAHVDVVSGATFTSNGVKNAVKQALAQAEKK